MIYQKYDLFISLIIYVKLNLLLIDIIKRIIVQHLNGYFKKSNKMREAVFLKKMFANLIFYVLVRSLGVI